MQTIVNGVTTNYTSNGVNEYTSVGGTTYRYDAAGNLISMTNPAGTTSYAYDSLNRLVSVSSPSHSWIYEYNALGNLVSTIYDGQTTNNLVDPNGAAHLVGQFNSSGSLIAGYTYGLGLVGQTTTAGTGYYQFDGVGSTVGLTNATGGLVDTYSYSPFGGLLASTGTAANPFTFAGQLGVTNGGSGLLGMGARSYDPSTGQFTTNDPLGFGAGDTNIRRYAANDPVQFIDPTGLWYFDFNGTAGIPGTRNHLRHSSRDRRGRRFRHLSLWRRRPGLPGGGPRIIKHLCWNRKSHTRVDQ